MTRFAPWRNLTPSDAEPAGSRTHSPDGKVFRKDHPIRPRSRASGLTRIRINHIPKPS